jgi:hypothetical protein
VQSLIDVVAEPQSKIALLSGNVNTTRCPNCGAPNTVLTPLLYHDSSKDLLISFVPMELGLSKDAQEKAIGDLVRELTTNLPQGAFKGYMLQPKQALTMQGLIEQVLQSDGVTPEMMQAQRERAKLVETFLQTSEESLPELIKQYDTQIDAQFIQTMTLVIQQLLGEGQQAAAEQLAFVQSRIIELSTYGQQLAQRAQAQEAIIAEVAEAVNALGDGAQRADFLNLAVQYVGEPERLEALVGLVRPVFDYVFFQEMTALIGQSPSAERDQLEELREQLLQLTARIDQQAQTVLHESMTLLQALINSPNPDELIQANLPLIDSTFMQVLAANIQEFTRRGDVNATAKLKAIYERVVSVLQSNLPPELRFVNELLNASTDDEARDMIAQRANEFGQSLVSALDAVEQQLTGEPDSPLMERFALLRREVESVLQ